MEACFPNRPRQSTNHPIDQQPRDIEVPFIGCEVQRRLSRLAIFFLSIHIGAAIYQTRLRYPHRDS